MPRAARECAVICHVLMLPVCDSDSVLPKVTKAIKVTVTVVAGFNQKNFANVRNPLAAFAFAMLTAKMSTNVHHDYV